MIYTKFCVTSVVDYTKFIQQYHLTNFPVGLGGCRVYGNSFDVCDYDLTVFDNKQEPSTVVSFENRLIHIHHGSFDNTQTKTLLSYLQMRVIHDDSWDLRTFLLKIHERKSTLFNDHAKNCILDSLFSSKKSLDGLGTDVFSPCWQKCASFYLAEAICALNQKNLSPSHMLESMRSVEKTPINETLTVVNETIGMERATPTLLERMLKSTIGFSALVEM